MVWFVYWSHCRAFTSTIVEKPVKVNFQIPAGIDRVLYDPTLNESPASCSISQRTVWVNPKSWRKLNDDQRFFILAHEAGHINLMTDNEFLADQYAHYEYVKSGRSPKQSVFALSEVLTGAHPEHTSRTQAQLKRAAQYDYEFNGNKKALKLIDGSMDPVMNFSSNYPSWVQEVYVNDQQNMDGGGELISGGIALLATGLGIGAGKNSQYKNDQAAKMQRYTAAQSEAGNAVAALDQYVKAGLITEEEAKGVGFYVFNKMLQSQGIDAPIPEAIEKNFLSVQAKLAAAGGQVNDPSIPGPSGSGDDWDQYTVLVEKVIDNPTNANFQTMADFANRFPSGNPIFDDYKQKVNANWIALLQVTGNPGKYQKLLEKFHASGSDADWQAVADYANKFPTGDKIFEDYAAKSRSGYNRTIQAQLAANKAGSGTSNIPMINLPGVTVTPGGVQTPAGNYPGGGINPGGMYTTQNTPGVTQKAGMNKTAMIGIGVLVLIGVGFWLFTKK